MERRSQPSDKGPVLAAVIALLVLGVGSVFLTWQNIRRQRELVDQHLLLSAGAVLHGVEANLMRIMHALGRSPDLAQRLFPTIRDVFQEITASGEIVFLGVFDEDGALLVSSAREGEPEAVALPEEIIASLEVNGRWSGPLTFHGKTALFSALRARPSFSRLCSDVVQGVPPLPPELRPGGPRGPGMGRGFGMGPGRGRGPMREIAPVPDMPGPARLPDVPSLFLVAALSPDRHMAHFDAYRRAALLQTGYVLAAATVLWFLALAYLNRRNQALKAARLERFQSRLLDNMPDGLLTIGPDGTILSANGSAERMLLPEPGPEAGPTAGLVGRSIHDFPIASGEDARPDAWRQVEHAGRILEVLCLPLNPAGEGRGGPGEHEGEAGERLALLRDRTRLRTLEDDLAEAKRLAAIGSLAAGVAHEIRNPLSSLRGFAQLFATKLSGQEPLASYACTMVQEADRLNRVVTDLLFLARPREITPARVDLTQVAESLRGLLRFDLERKRIAPELDLEEGFVCADEDALRQALLNLIVNALDAVPDEGGRITLGARREEAQEPGGEAGVWISVADNGPGMDEAVRKQAFEPFFTAKRQGTGLGLAIVQGIMRAHRGRALIDSAPGRGTAVRLFFPDCPEAHDRAHGGDAHDQA